MLPDHHPVMAAGFNCVRHSTQELLYNTPSEIARQISTRCPAGHKPIPNFNAPSPYLSLRTPSFDLPSTENTLTKRHHHVSSDPTPIRNIPKAWEGVHPLLEQLAEEQIPDGHLTAGIRAHVESLGKSQPEVGVRLGNGVHWGNGWIWLAVLVVVLGAYFRRRRRVRERRAFELPTSSVRRRDVGMCEVAIGRGREEWGVEEGYELV